MSPIVEHLVTERGASMAQVKAALRSWTIRPIIQGGRQVGEIMLKQSEVHFALAPEFRLKLGRRQLIQRELDALLEEHDFLVTTLIKGDPYRPLIEFMGFRKINEQGNVEHFWLDKETRNDRH